MSLKSRSLAIAFLAVSRCSSFAADSSAGFQDGSCTLNDKPVLSQYRTLRSLGLDRNEALITLGDMTFIMDQATNFAFAGDLDQDGRLYQVAGKEKLLVGLALHEVRENEVKRTADPFIGLTADDMKSVRGVYLDHELSEQAIDLLRHVDPSKTFFQITDEAGAGRPKKFPSIPHTATFLEIDESSSDGIEDYARLRSFTSLVYLSIQTLGGDGVDVTAIADNPDLAYLKVAGETLINIEALSQLHNLRQLDLSWCNEVTNSQILKSLIELRELHIPFTRIEDLSPLDGLTHITTVVASMTPVKVLPTNAVSNLSHLNVIGTQLTEDQVEAFCVANPQCLVRHGWTSTLKQALQGTDRLRVRTGGTCHTDPDQEKTLFEITDTADLEAVIARIALEPAASGFHCMCCGSPSFEFYRSGTCIVTLGFHHGRSLRWMDGDWPADALLANDSADFLLQWLADHGVTGPKEEHEEDIRREKESAVAKEKWLNAMPESLKPFFLSDLFLPSGSSKTQEMDSALMQQIPDQKVRILALLNWYGSGTGPWSGFPAYETLPEELLLLQSTEALLDAVHDTSLTDQHLEGLARLLGSWDFAKSRPNDLRLVPDELKTRLLTHCLQSSDDDKCKRAIRAFGDGTK